FVSKDEELVVGKAGGRRDFRNECRESINAVGDLTDFGLHQLLQKVHGILHRLRGSNRCSVQRPGKLILMSVLGYSPERHSSIASLSPFCANSGLLQLDRCDPFLSSGVSAYVGCPPLSFSLDASPWLRWQLKNRGLLTFTQRCQQHDLAIRKFQ